MLESPDIPASSGSTIFDRAAALANVEGDVGLLGEMAGLFLEDYPHQMLEIRDAMARGDATAVARSAHTVKGSVGNFAAQQAFEAARQLEMSSREGDLHRAQSEYAALETALRELEPVLARLAREAASGTKSQ